MTIMNAIAAMTTLKMQMKVVSLEMKNIYQRKG